MPRAKDNRKAVGTETCLKCGEQAEFYQVQKGRYLGYLYRKGCECKADQRTLPYVQLEWLERMTRTPHPMMAHPLDGNQAPPEPEPKPAPEPEPKPAEPGATSEGQPEPNPKRAAAMGLGVLVIGVAAALFS